jgi:hypothetical protein
MPTGSICLADFPHEMVRLTCRKCERKGQYRKPNLLQRYDPATAMPDLLRQLATGCPLLRDFGNDRCGAYYVDLAAGNVTSRPDDGR